jgi:hypothetical protein
MVELLLLIQMHGPVVAVVALPLLEQMQQQVLQETAVQEPHQLFQAAASPMLAVAVAAYKEQVKHLGRVVLGAVAVARGQFHLKTQLLEPPIQAAVAVVDVRRL